MEQLGDMAKLYAKVKAVYQDVNYIQKDKRNEFHRYNYASEAAIKDHLHEAFVKHGLVMLPPDVESVEDAKKINEKGKEEIITTARIRFGIADVDTGASVHGTLYGRGVDASDKGIYKAITGGLKYFLTTTFLIPTGDNPEEEDEKPDPKAATKPAATKQQAPKPQPVQQAQPTLRDLINGMLAVIGKDAFFRILGNDGYTAVSEIPDKPTAERILAAMRAEPVKEAVNA